MDSRTSIESLLQRLKSGSSSEAVRRKSSTKHQLATPPADPSSPSEPPGPGPSSGHGKIGVKDSDLKENQRREVTSKLLDAEVCFERRSRVGLPPRFYRTHHEVAATLSSNVTKDTHVRHRAEPRLRIRKRNAFQSISKFIGKMDLTVGRIERHLKWNMKRDPSSMISAFNSLARAEARAKFHYEESQRIGQRVFVAEILTKGLRPATVKARYETTETIFTKHGPLRINETSEPIKTTCDVNIPVWIRDTAIPIDDSNITLEQLENSGADMWLSITEIRKSDLQGCKSQYGERGPICMKGHDYEWLACGFILKSHIANIMPYDGKQLHKQMTLKVIRSLRSTDRWIFNWHRRMWLLNPNMANMAHYRIEFTSEKRRRDDDDNDEKGDVRQRPRLSYSPITTSFCISPAA